MGVGAGGSWRPGSSDRAVLSCDGSLSSLVSICAARECSWLVALFSSSMALLSTSVNCCLLELYAWHCSLYRALMLVSKAFHDSSRAWSASLALVALRCAFASCLPALCTCDGTGFSSSSCAKMAVMLSAVLLPYVCLMASSSLVLSVCRVVSLTGVMSGLTGFCCRSDLQSSLAALVTSSQLVSSQDCHILCCPAGIDTWQLGIWLDGLHCFVVAWEAQGSLVPSHCVACCWLLKGFGFCLSLCLSWFCLCLWHSTWVVASRSCGAGVAGAMSWALLSWTSVIHILRSIRHAHHWCRSIACIASACVNFCSRSGVLSA